MVSRLLEREASKPLREILEQSDDAGFLNLLDRFVAYLQGICWCVSTMPVFIPWLQPLSDMLITVFGIDSTMGNVDVGSKGRAKRAHCSLNIVSHSTRVGMLLLMSSDD